MGAHIGRWSLRFDDAQLERRFREAENSLTLRAGRVAAVGGFLLSLVPSVLVLAFAPDDWLPRKSEIVLGTALLNAMFLLSWAFTYWDGLMRRPQAFNVVFGALFAAAMATLLRLFPLEFVTHRGFLFVALQLFGTYGLLRLRIWPGVLAGALCIGAYIIVMQSSGMLGRADLARHFFWTSMCAMWGLLVCYQLEMARRREFAAHEEVEHERARAEGLLLNILPAAIAARLKASRERIAEHAEDVTVLFADIVGFTPMSAGKSPGELVALLDRVFTEFDALAQAHGLEKIKTIGDAYMAVAGLPQAQPDHAVRAARMAVDMLVRVRALAQQTGEDLQLRVGLNSGPVVAGVIGRSKFSYDLWGDTVNTASRMESTGLAGAVHCAPATAALLQGLFPLRARGAIEVKGKGMMETYLL